jgi:hypothetical protein
LNFEKLEAEVERPKRRFKGWKNITLIRLRGWPALQWREFFDTVELLGQKARKPVQSEAADCDVVRGGGPWWTLIELPDSTSRLGLGLTTTAGSIQDRAVADPQAHPLCHGWTAGRAGIDRCRDRCWKSLAQSFLR